MSKIAWIGLGAMGFPMAGCLGRAGLDVTAFDIAPGRAQQLSEFGVKAAGSAEAAVAEADVVALMVATPAQVDSVLFGESDLAAAIPAGAIVLVMATVGPEPVADWTAKLAGRGVRIVDAPVSGGVARAGTGELLMMVSGDPEDVAVVRPLLEAMASHAPVVGAVPGEGQKMKLVNQLLCGVHIAVAGEALAFAERLGLDIGATWEVLRHGAANSFMFSDRGERMVNEEFDVAKSAIDIFVKDMGLVVDAAEQNGFAAPIADAAKVLYLEGAAAEMGRKDDSSVLEIYRNR
ncbi:NAD(P)-dependent oxidoreductase [Saxibacter everestensis]|uniref:NAD(P)-dependent oxidoreductase n=1 Tax=Saxibacter everestensis TaxID=2909229 RepID=A0ABY8QU96_9MICO|nr:NAD(P)-dependent oxidoreductase [Brevibacteriaceae bacterium ZFBP1038]